MISHHPALASRARPVAEPIAPHITATSVSLDFPTNQGGLLRVLDDITLTIPRGSFVSLLGPSGCGKSTLLKVLAGLLAPASGTVTVAGMAPEAAQRARRIGLVFQDATLLPWRDALANAEFLLQVTDRSLSAATIRARALEMFRLVGLEGAEHRLPWQLSGGMRQRVAIARALTLDPDVLLMDEPFGALDAITRETMGSFLLDLWQRTAKTIVFVTHSINEAIFLSREVHVMAAAPGRLLASLAIPLAYPRTELSYADPAFGEIATELRLLLRAGHQG